MYSLSFRGPLTQHGSALLSPLPSNSSLIDATRIWPSGLKQTVHDTKTNMKLIYLLKTF